MLYGIEWTYGRASKDDGTREATYHSFESASERYDWLDEGPDYVTDPGYREMLLSSDSELRRLQRLDREYVLKGDRANIRHHEKRNW